MAVTHPVRMTKAERANQRNAVLEGCFGWTFDVRARAVHFCLAVLVLWAGTASAQDHAAHVIPVVPQELLNRPLAIRAGIGRAHDAVTTRSVEAQQFYDQGLNYLHGYVWIEAARSFNHALRADGRLALAWVGLSYAYTELNQPNEARGALDRARGLASDVNAHDRLHLDARAAQMAAEAAPRDRAKLAAYRARLDSTLVTLPGDAELWMLRGIAESPDPSDRGQGSVVSAIPFYQKALALGGLAAHHYVTHALENANRIAEALPHADAYARAAPAIPHALHMHGHVLLRTGRMSDAVAAFEAANRVEADYFRTEGIPPAYDWHHEHNLGLLAASYRYLGQMASARRRLQEAFELPSALIAQMYNKRAWPEFLIARGQFDEALVAADILSAHQSSLVRATGHIEAGLALFAKGRVQAAVERSNLALRDMRAATDGQALLLPALQQLQGQLFLRTGQRERGRSMIQALSQALRALPGPDNWVQALFTIDALARGAREADEWELAGSLARQMIAHDTHYAGGHYTLALVLEHAGDGPGANAEFAAAGRAWAQADTGLPELARTGTVRPPGRR